MKLFKKKKILLGIIIVPILILGLYWLKNLLGIDVFESYSLSRQFPFDQLQRDIIVSPISGDILIEESFNTNGIFQQEWSDLWMREEGKVIQEYDTNGIRQSRCLLISSGSEKDWAYSSLKMVEVKEGDSFSYQGWVYIQGKDVNAYFGLTSYDGDKNVIDWKCESVEIKLINEFQKIEKQFTITRGIGFIRFVIGGRGKGEFRFDDVKFQKQ